MHDVSRVNAGGAVVSREVGFPPLAIGCLSIIPERTLGAVSEGGAAPAKAAKLLSQL